MRRSTDSDNEDYSRERTLCVDHENRIKSIEERQKRIYVSMYGPNGDAKEGYVWKLEKVLDWAEGVKDEWGSIKSTALSGAKAAIALLFTAFLSGVGYLIWQLIRMAADHGKL